MSFPTTPSYALFLFGLLSPLASPGAHAVHARLHLDVYVADSTGYDVTSTLIAGPTEGILVDTQGRVSDATKLADRIAAAGIHLKAVIISHPDDDHFMGIAVFKRRFPATPVYISAAGRKEMGRTGQRIWSDSRKYAPVETPDTLPMPETLPTTHFTIDGEAVDVIPDRQGDHWVTSNSYLWIPSLRAIVAGDIVFNGVHMWLRSSTPKTRAAWHRSLDELARLNPAVVVAGHKRDAQTPDSPDIIARDKEYLTTFDAFADRATGSDDLIARMKARYPDWRLTNILARAARATIPD